HLVYSCRSVFFFSSRRRHTRFSRDWSSDVCSSDLSCFYLLIKGNYCLQSTSKRNKKTICSDSLESGLIQDMPCIRPLTKQQINDTQVFCKITAKYLGIYTWP